MQNVARVQQRDALQQNQPVEGLVVPQCVEDARLMMEEERRSGRIIVSKSEASTIV